MDIALNVSPCVDVVVPVFNGRGTIEAAIQSVLAQRGAWVRRIIVVDDGSTDDTADVVERLGVESIELLRTSNRGVAAARNLGVDACTSEWVAFLDADDVWVPHKVDTQLAAARAHGAGFVCTAVRTQSGREAGPISVRSMVRGNFVATSSVLVRRDVLQQVKPLFKPGMAFAEDYLAWLKCITLTDGYYVSEKLVDYILSERPRYRWGQILHNLWALNIEYGRFLREIGSPRLLRIGFGSAVFLGTLRSLMSIIRRFMSSDGAGTLKE